jgi:hypothetical protein
MESSSHSQEFEELCDMVLGSRGVHEVQTLEEIEFTSVECLLKACCMRVVRDPFLRLAGKKLYSGSCFLRVTSRGLLTWLFGGEEKPLFFM